MCSCCYCSSPPPLNKGPCWLEGLYRIRGQPKVKSGYRIAINGICKIVGVWLNRPGAPPSSARHWDAEPTAEVALTLVPLFPGTVLVFAADPTTLVSVDPSEISV